MRKATVTYVAPVGDNKVVEMGGVTFFDGKSVEINSHEHPHLISRLQSNAHFDVEVSEEDDKEAVTKAKRGRPSAAAVAEVKARAEATQKEAEIANAKAEEARADAEKADEAMGADKSKGKIDAKSAQDEPKKDTPEGFTGTSSRPMSDQVV
jgi:hypothetical protein